MRYIHLLLAILVALSVSACGGGGGGGNSSAPSQPPGPPTITGFSPAFGATGTIVAITGTNFSTTAALNTVMFNGTAATVTAASATSLIVTVPAGASTGAITVATAGGSATSPAGFTVSAAPVGSGSGTATQYFSKRAVGNNWNYTENVTATASGAGTQTFTYSFVDAITASAGGAITESETVTPTSPSGAPTVYTATEQINAAGALVSTDSSSGVTSVILPATFSVGTSWVRSPATDVTPASVSTIVAFNVTRTVPAGTFTDCLQVTNSSVYVDGTGIVYMQNETVYFSPSAGNFVDGSVSTSNTGGGSTQISMPLQSYTAN